MTIQKGNIYFRIPGFALITLLFLWSSCKKNILDEEPLSFLTSDNALTSKSGFENAIMALHAASREEVSGGDTYWTNNFNGTGMYTSGGSEYVKYSNFATWLNPSATEVAIYWNWAYSKMLIQANTIIVYANKPELAGIWQNEAERNAILAEARFFRGYTYNILANIYGGVPLVDTIYASPKFDFVRNTREEVYLFARADLEFASTWLPPTVVKTSEGRIVKAAADHLLAEVNISLGDYGKAIKSASDVINSNLYQLMTIRFGSRKSLPGDVFSDLFAEGNQNRSSGNLESIYVWQFEESTDGGYGTSGNKMLRNFAPFLIRIKDAAGIPLLASDSLGRGTGYSRGTNYALYQIWQGDWDNDIRNSQYNMRRVFYYNNPASAVNGQVINKNALTKEDSLRGLYSYSRKVEGKPWNNTITSGATSKDAYVYRLAETYLLRAEAHLRNGSPDEAANDINVVRRRANATEINAGDVTLEYILDERARELMTEESRRRTLTRMGKLVEHVRKYDLLENSRNTIADYNEFYPIPQASIDANTGVKLEQNPGYF